MNKIIVVGGGAAGMMAAIAAARAGARVCLIEKNEKLGKKIFITGKGRCNVTNAGDMETLFANCVSNEKFLYSAFYGFDNRAVMDLIEKAGCPLKIERGDRVFPISDHSSDVIAALSRELRRLEVEIMLHTRVKELLVETSSVDSSETEEHVGENLIVKTSFQECSQPRITGVLLDDGRRMLAERVIVATGGLSYPTTGSTGDGYRFALDTGHRMTDTMPSLVPMETEESWCKDIMGLALKNVSVRLSDGKKSIYEGFGEMLFTHFGISGPLVLSASSYYVHWLAAVKKKNAKKNADNKKNADKNTDKKNDRCDVAGAVPTRARFYIDLKPALDEEQLDKRILRDFEENINKQFKNAIIGLFPAKLVPIMISLSGIHPDKKVNEISREERRNFVKLIKNLPLTVTGVRDYNEAIITQGGIMVKDINPSTMESKKVSGLYFAGEVLDLDALTGGFNLQIAWSTGYLAGASASE